MGAAFSKIVCISAGLLYPAYASFKALESPKDSDDKQWLTYWIVYSLTTSVETVSDKVFSWFPGYYMVKTLLLIWLMLPKTQGATKLYNRVIHPFLMRNQATLDRFILRVQALIRSYLLQLRKSGAELIASSITSLEKSLADAREETPKKRSKNVIKPTETVSKHAVSLSEPALPVSCERTEH